MKHLHHKVTELTRFWTRSAKLASLLQLLFQLEALHKFSNAPASEDIRLGRQKVTFKQDGSRRTELAAWNFKPGPFTF